VQALPPHARKAALVAAGVVAAMTVRRTVVRRLAAPGIHAARTVYIGCPVDVLRVAALVEISAAAANLARTVVRMRRLDPASIAAYVADPTDARAVLGRGRWLPSMTAHVPAPAAGKRTPTRRRKPRTGSSAQLPLPLPGAEGR
jgi:hypothetical protein